MALAWTAATGPELVNQLTGLADAAPPLQAALRAVMRHVDQHPEQYALSLAVGRLIEQTPSLRARSHEKYLLWEDLLATTLIAHGAPSTHSRMASALALSGLRLAVREWIASDGQQPLAGLLAEAYHPFLIPNQPQQNL
ncbi:hypothetical protein [Hymenobacter wooponensis]|nr:hypothetical protein [Hymenobacter wooponensis]